METTYDYYAQNSFLSEVKAPKWRNPRCLTLLMLRAKASDSPHVTVTHLCTLSLPSINIPVSHFTQVT